MKIGIILGVGPEVFGQIDLHPSVLQPNKLGREIFKCFSIIEPEDQP